MKHVKRIGIIVGVCVPIASKEWCQHDASSSMKEEESDVEIRIENVHQ